MLGFPLNFGVDLLFQRRKKLRQLEAKADPHAPKESTLLNKLGICQTLPWTSKSVPCACYALTKDQIYIYDAFRTVFVVLCRGMEKMTAFRSKVMGARPCCICAIPCILVDTKVDVVGCKPQRSKVFGFAALLLPGDVRVGEEIGAE